MGRSFRPRPLPDRTRAMGLDVGERRVGVAVSDELGAIATPLVAYHEHNEREMAQRLIERLAGGEDIALVSDVDLLD